MTAYLLTDHLLNFVAPAAVVALVLVLSCYSFRYFFKSKKSETQSPIRQVAIIFVANVFILMAGLIFFGNDGKMATYAALVAGSALCQWLLMRGWRA